MISFKRYLGEKEKDKTVQESMQYDREMARQNSLTQLKQDQWYEWYKKFDQKQDQQTNQHEQKFLMAEYQKKAKLNELIEKNMDEAEKEKWRRHLRDKEHGK